MRNDILEAIKRTLIAIRDILPQLFPAPAYEQDPKTLPMNEEKPTPQVPTQQLLSAMLKAIEKHEGFYPGSRSYRNHSPGNLKWVGQPKAIGKDPQGFAIFANYQDGYDALKFMVLNAARGGSKIYKPDMTLRQFFALYAPAADSNDPDHYANVVAKAMNVDANTFRLRELL